MKIEIFEWHNLMAHVGKYILYMDCMGWDELNSSKFYCVDDLDVRYLML